MCHVSRDQVVNLKTQILRHFWHLTAFSLLLLQPYEYPDQDHTLPGASPGLAAVEKFQVRKIQVLCGVLERKS